MQRTNIYLDERQTERLDRLAREEGISRAEVIRRLLDRALDGRDGDLEADLARIDLAFGGAVEMELPVREPDERDRGLDALLDADA